MAVSFLSWSHVIKEKYSNQSYFSFINQGNRLLYKGDVESALEKYLLAFQVKHHHYFLDIQKAIVLSNKLGAHKIKSRLLLKVKEDGMIDKASFLSHFKSSAVFTEGDISIINTLSLKENEGLEEFYDLFRSDQKVRLLRKDTSLGTKKEKQLSEASWEEYVIYRDSIDELNALLFINHCEKYGLPFEGNIGISTFYNPDNQQEYKTNVIAPILCMHFLRTKYKNEILRIINLGLENGVLHPSQFAWLAEVLYENQQNKDSSYPYMNTTVNIVGGEYYRPFVIYSDSLMKVVDSNRTEIGLDSFKYAQEQSLCSRICRDSLTGSSNILDIYNYSTFSQFGLGLVKYTFEKENADLNFYKIKTDRITDTCECNNLTY